MVDLAKTFTLYKIDDVAFPLDDERCRRVLDKFGKTFFSVKGNEYAYIVEEYGRRHGMPRFILDIWLHYYRANEYEKPVSEITTPVNELYHWDFEAIPIETTKIADTRSNRLYHSLKDRIIFRETYWDNVNFNLHMLEGVKVRDINKSDYTSGTKKESFGISDSNRTAYTKNNRYSLRIAEKSAKHINTLRLDVTGVTDEYSRDLEWLRASDESVLMFENQSSVSRKQTKEDLQIMERPIKAVYINPCEVVLIVDSHVAFFNWFQMIREKITVLDHQRKRLYPRKKESLTVTPLLINNLARSFPETIKAIDRYMSHAKPKYKEQTVTLTDDEKNIPSIIRSEMLHVPEIYWDNVLFLINISENIRATDVIRKTAQKQLYDALYFMDFLRKVSKVKQAESISVIEGQRQTLEHVLYESVRVSDEIARYMRKYMREQIQAMDAISKRMDTVNHEQLSINDGWYKVWDTIKTLREELKTLDKINRDIYNQQDERLIIADKSLVQTEHKLKEALSVEESFNRDAVFSRVLSDLVVVGDSLSKDAGKNPAEDIAVYDAYLRASNAYIEALQVVSSAKEAADFLAMSDTPPLYEEFTDFNVGDYEYEKAMLRLRVVSNATHSQPLLYDVAPHVDIDDTDDRGQIQIKDATRATKVYYNKHYYNPPEVQVTVKGGSSTTSLVPRIISTDKSDDGGRYFEVELHDTDDKLTTGVISWVAKGW